MNKEVEPKEIKADGKKVESEQIMAIDKIR